MNSIDKLIEELEIESEAKAEQGSVDLCILFHEAKIREFEAEKALLKAKRDAEIASKNLLKVFDYKYMNPSPDNVVEIGGTDHRKSKDETDAGFRANLNYEEIVE